MGRRGPPPTPTATLAKRGSWRAKRRTAEPPAPREAPEPPAWLTKPELPIWRDVLAKLSEIGTLSRVDAATIARYVRALLRWRRNSDALLALDKQGNPLGEVIAVRDDAGNLKYLQQTPHVAIVNNLEAILLRLEQQFGLTPSARASLAITVGKATDAVNKKNRFFTQ